MVDSLGFKPIGQRIDVYRNCDQCKESTTSSSVSDVTNEEEKV